MSFDKLDRYDIKRELGRGGMSTVYRAYDPRFEREVAIKVMPPEFLHDPTFRTRFEREAKTIAALEHAAIVPVYDYGEAEGRPYLVMRYMSGGSLSDRVKEGSLPFDQIVKIFRQIGNALDTAHAKGVIHRDLKPANILFDAYGEAFLADFGIVKMTEATAQLTGSGIVGTPAYMAPEMAQAGGVSPMIDIYALGVTLYQALTGKLPYDADTPVGLLMAHVSQPVPDIRAQRPDLPEGIQHAINRALAKEPTDRYQHAADLSADLEALAAGRGIAPFTPSVAPSPVGQVTPPDALTMDVAGTPVRQETYGTSVAPLTGVEPPATPLARPTPRPQAPPAHRPQARKGMPGWGWALIGLAAIALLLVLIGGGAAVAAIALRPTATPTPSPTPTVTPTPTNTPTPTPRPVTQFTQLYTLRGHSSDVWAVAVSPDGGTIATGSADDTIKLWDAQTGSSFQTLRGHADDARALAFSPDGSILASGSYDETIILWDTSTWREIRTLTGHTSQLRAVAFSPDGSLLASAAADNNVILWNVSSGRIGEVLSGHTYDVRCVAFSPDGSLLASGGNDLTAIVWNVSSGQIIKKINHDNNVRALAFTLDGSTLVSGLYTIPQLYLWDTGNWQRVGLLDGHSQGVADAVFTPDGSVLASGGDDGLVILWDFYAARILKTLRGHSGPIRDLEWSPGGDFLVSGSTDDTAIVWGSR